MSSNTIHIPLRAVLIIPFVALTLIAVGLTGYLSFHNGQQAVNDVAAQLRSEIATKIEQRLETFLETPHLINEINANAMQQGRLEANDSTALERYFWEQVQIFETVTSIYFGNTQGGLANAGREGAEGFLYVIETEDFTAGPFKKYATDAQGNRTELLVTVPNFDARTRPWYTRARETGRPAWSEIFILFTGQDLALAASRPVYDANGTLLGVVSNDIFLSDLSHFLQDLRIGQTGEAFIMEHSGLLVASSSGEQLFSPAADGQPQQRLQVAASSNPLVRAGAEQLEKQFGNLEAVDSNRQFEFWRDGQRYFGQVVPFHEARGLDWLIVVVIPEADFMARINAQARTTMLLILTTLGLAVIGSIVVARWVAAPLLSLNKAAKALAQGETPLAVTASRIHELGQLTHSFNSMATQLSQSLESLTAEVAQRQQAEEELQVSRDQLAGIIAAAMDAIVTVDENQRIVFYNAAAERMFGYPAAEMIGQPHNRLIPERLRASHWQHIEQFGRTGVTRRHMRHLAPLGALRANGQEFPVEVSISQVTVGGRKLYTAILRDITEKLQMEEDLRQSEARYRSLFEEHPAVMLQIDPAERLIVDANPAAAAYYGWSRDELRHMKIEQINTLSPAEIEAEIERANTANQFQFIFKHRRADGSIRDVEVFSGPFEFQGKTLLYSIVQDITDRRWAEGQLRLNLERLSLAGASAGIGIWDTDMVTGTMVWDDRMYELYGFDRATTPATYENWIQSIHPEDVPAVVAAGEAALEGSRDYHLQFRLIRPDGQTRHIEAHAIVQRDEAGQPLRIIGVNRDITEQKIAEAALRQSEDRYRSTLDHMLEGCQIIGFDWRYLYVNDAVTTQGKQTKEALLGRTMLEMYPGIDQTALFSDLRRCMDERVATQIENEFLFPDGSKGWFELSVQPVPEGLFILSFDITERKQAEAALHESEERLRLFIDHAPASLAMFNREMRYLARSRRWLVDYQLEGQDVIGRSHYEVLAEIPERWKAIHRRGLEGEVIRAEEDFFIRLDGTVQWLRWEVRPWSTPAGSIGGIVIFTEDITARKQVETDLQYQKETLQTIIDHIPVMIGFIDPYGQFLLVNQEFERVLGWTFEEMSERPDILTEFYPDPEVRQAVIDYANSAEPGWREFKVTTRSGQVLDTAWANVRLSNGTTIGIGQDLSELNRTREQLYQAQKMESMGRLAGGIAHDFNNLLVPILGYAELGMMQIASDTKLYTNLSYIRQAADRAANLTRQILAFSRQQVLEMSVVDLNSVITDFKKMLQRLIGEDIELRTVLAPTLAPVIADKGQLEQVLMNLVINARDAMSGGGRITLETANVFLDERYASKHVETKPGPYVMVAVSDTGHGMDAATQQRIFDPFFTTKERGKGTGLGLATVFGIVKQHQGYIWTYSEPGVGTTFKIYLPQATDLASTGEPADEDTASIFGTETILVTEDEEVVRKLVCETLESHGYQVLEAAGPEQGLQLAARYPGSIHLLLTDVIMPGMNGRDLYQKLVEFQPECRVLYMSGYTDEVIGHQHILEEGVNFLQKPFTVQSLMQKVSMALS